MDVPFAQGTFVKLVSSGARKPLSAYRLTDMDSCLHFFRCLDTDGVMRDSVGNVTLSSGAALSTGGTLSLTYDSALKALSSNMLNTTNPVAIGGGWTGVSGALLVLYCGRITSFADVRVSLGDVNGLMGGNSYGIGVPGNAAPHVAVRGPNGLNKNIQVGIHTYSLSGGAGYSAGLTATHVPGTSGTGVVVAPPSVSGGAITDIEFIHAGYDFIASSDPAVVGTLNFSQVGSPVATYTLTGGLAAGLDSYHVGKDILFLAKYTPGNQLYFNAFDVNDGTEYLRCTVDSGVTAYDVGAFTPDAYMRWSGLSLYGCAVFEFDVIPDDWLVAAKWMAASWKTGDKYLWPGWA